MRGPRFRFWKGRGGASCSPRPPWSAAAAPRGVALVNALLVVAALAAISVTLLARADRAFARLAQKATGDQLGAYLDAGQAQAMADLTRAMDDNAAAALRAGQGWDAPRDVPIDRGQVAWTTEDLQGRFNLGWLASEQAWGDAARDSFRTLALSLDLPEPLIERLIRAAGPDTLARAGALGTPFAPDLPLILPQQLAAAARPDEGGAQALAGLWPYLAALPPDTGWTVASAPLPVAQALIPGLDALAWDAFAQARLAGEIDTGGALSAYAAQNWPPDVVARVAALPLADETEWLELRLQARLDSQTRGRSVVIDLGRPGPDEPPETHPENHSGPRAVLSLPIGP